MVPTLTIPTLPRRVARAVANRVRDVVARRTAPPVVLAVRRERLTRLTPRALAELHECVVEAEEASREGVVVTVGEATGGAAIVLADARSSARAVCVYGVSGERPALTAALARHGCAPDASRVSLHDGLPDAQGAPVAVGHLATRDPEALRAALAALVGRLVPGGVIVVDAYPIPACRAVVEALRGDLRPVQRAAVHLVSEPGRATRPPLSG